MRKLICLLAVVVLGVLSAGPLRAAPKIQIDGQTFNFGFVPQESKISHSFWLKSVGEDTLRILKVVPG